jgi:hypothetical protein
MHALNATFCSGLCQPPALEANHLLERMLKYCLHIGESLPAKDSLMIQDGTPKPL